ncbi:MAG TPA: divalent metal cation transporter FieF, partial [Pseudomonas sp.]|nr:divalent metal cation transporter FieF [Pseudomonas sp.]
LDGAASLINLLAVHYSLRPADDDHRYGHGKAEALAGLGQAAFIGVSALLVGAQGVDRLLHPQPLGAPLVGIVVIVVSLLLTAALLAYQRHVVRLTGSTAIRADSLHYRSDLLLNLSILLALVLASYGWARLDAVFGIAIAFYILWSAASILREAAAVLMDTELSPEIGEDMQRLARNVPGVLGCHDLRTRISGTRWFVQLHLELPGELSLSRAHALCDEVEAAIKAHYPRAEVLVHADPQEVVKKA